MQEKTWGRKSREFKVHSLIDKVYKLLNLYIAWEKVKTNKGAGGVDKVSLEGFQQNLELNLQEIHRLLHEDRYIPQSIRRVWIPKSNGEKRPLGIPTIRDRVVQAEAALRRIREILEEKLKLKLNAEKSRIVHKSWGFEFLGFKFGSGYSDYKIPRDRAIKAFKDKIRLISRRHQPKSMSMIITELNPVVRGWGNYFIRGNCGRIFIELDFWLRNRITAFKLKRQGGYGHRKYPYSRLRAMGMLFLKDLLYAKRPELIPVMGQHLRRAGCRKSARPVR